jgi:hypothetical protein
LLNNYDLLVREAGRLWGPLSSRAEAQQKIERLRQETTVANYYAEFMKDAPLTEYNDVALATAFYNGLKGSIKDMMVNIQRPETTTGLLQTALRFEERILARARERGFVRPITRQARTARMDQDERTRHLREGRCFTCHETGHMARNCPKKNTKTQIYARKTSTEGEEEDAMDQDFAQD